MKLIWYIDHFDRISKLDFHDLISLRIEVFVIEQDCPYQDLDGLDIDAWHVYAKDESGIIVACARVLKPDVSYKNMTSIGRVVVKESHRGIRLGDDLVARSVVFARSQYPDLDIKISAQEHLRSFYEKHGFEKSGGGYLEDGIPHIPMVNQV